MFSDWNPQACEVAVEHRRVGVHVEQTRNADAEVLAVLHQRSAFLRSLFEIE